MLLGLTEQRGTDAPTSGVATSKKTSQTRVMQLSLWGVDIARDVRVCITLNAAEILPRFFHGGSQARNEFHCVGKLTWRLWMWFTQTLVHTTYLNSFTLKNRDLRSMRKVPFAPSASMHRHSRCARERSRQARSFGSDIRLPCHSQARVTYSPAPCRKGRLDRHGNDKNGR